MEKLYKESFQQFKDRINSFAWDGLYTRDNFHIRANAIYKVDYDGSFKSFFGNTVVFDLPNEVKDYAYEVQEKLYSYCPSMMAERLTRESFHITLHDLLNGTPSEELEKQVEVMSIRAKELMKEIQLQKKTLNFTTTALMNMVNVSMVLVVEPADEETYNAMMALYVKFEQLLHLHYSLTPHITLAYYKPGVYGADVLNPLADLIAAVNAGPKCKFTVDTDMLMYQIFTDMKNFKTV